MGLLSGLCRGRRAAAAVVAANGLRNGRARDDKQWYHNPNPDAPERRPTVLVDSSGSSRLEDGDQHAPTIPAHQETERYHVREGYRIDDSGGGEAGPPAEGAQRREFQSSFCPDWDPPSHYEERTEAAPPRRPPLSKSSGAGAASWNDDGSSRKEERPRRLRSSSRSSHRSSRSHRDRSSSGSHRSASSRSKHRSRRHGDRSSSRSERSSRSHDRSSRRHKDRSSSRSHRSSRHRPSPPPENLTPEQQIAMLEAAAQSILDRVRGETSCDPSRSRTSSNTKEGRSHSKRRHSSRHSGTHSSRSSSKGQRRSKSKESGARSHSTARSHSSKASSKSRSNSHSQPRSRARHRPPHPDRIDYQGRCPGHPDVVLQRYSRKKGEWRTLLEECPLCGAEDSGDIEVEIEGENAMEEKAMEEECATASSQELNQELAGNVSKVSWKPAENDANKPKPKRARSASQPRSTKAPPRRSRSNNPRPHAKSHPGPVEGRPRRPSVEEIISHSQNQSRQSLNGNMNGADEGAFYRELARRLVCGKSSDADKPPSGAKKSANDDDSDAHLLRGTSNGTETTASLSTATSSLDPPSLPRRSSREFRHPKEVYFGGGDVCEAAEEEQQDCRDECARSLGSGQESEEGLGEDAVGTAEGEEQADAQDVDATFCLPCNAEANREPNEEDAPKIVRFADEANVLDYLASRVQESSIGQRLRGSFRS